jgi:hypothetical protein
LCEENANRSIKIKRSNVKRLNDQKPELKMTPRQAYFTSWTPRETRESYNQEEKTVDYDIYCTPLTVAGSPSDIFQW